MSDLQRLINRRNALVTQVRGALAVADSLGTRKPSPSEVTDRLEQLKVVAADFRSTQNEIEELQPNADAIASVHDFREEFFNMFYKAKDSFEAYLGEFDDIGSSTSQRTVEEPSEWKDALRLLVETQRQLMLNQAAQAAQNNHGGGQASNGLPHLNVRLPAISVPTFSGDRKQWSTFKDLYVSTIHNRADLAPSLKMQYLFSYLDGDAKRLVNKFAISSANYTLAWEALTTYYDKKRFTVFSLVRDFMDQPTVTTVTPQNLNKLVTNSDEIVQQLDSLGDEFKSRDPWLIHLMLEKLDKETRASWSQKVIEIDNPTFEQLLEFLKKRCEMLETCSAFTKKATIEVKKDAAKPTTSTEKKIKSLHSTTTTNQKCAKCSAEHNTYQCEEFKKLSVEERREVVQKGRLCFNCLRPGHSVKACNSKSACHTPDCKQRHHTMLCFNAKKSEESSEKSDKEKSTASSSVVPEKEKIPEEKVIASLMAKVPEVKQQTIALLPTAVVKVRKENGGYLEAKVLIDSGSQASLITEECVRKLGLQRRNGKLVVSGLGQQEVGTTRGVAKLFIANRFDEIVVIETDAYILGKLTSTIPSQRFDVTNLKLLENIGELADPEFNRPGPIDIILGSDVFLALLEGGQVKDDSGQTVAQRTVFGWIVAGRYDGADDTISSNHAIINLHTEMDLNRTLRQFWEQEEVTKAPSLTPSEQVVIEHFKSTVTRDPTGRFIVRLPLDDSKPALGDSLTAATKRMRSIEKRFEVQPVFKQQYVAFIQEYLELGHMEEVPTDQVGKASSQCYYLPHHAVIKEASTTTKLRAVFDGSCGTSTGVSLNDRLLAGPNINADLFSVSLRFRSHKVVFCADVTKMYRQVLVHPDDRDFQRIVFREDPTQPFKHYRLCTVTYGTKTAPYLAIAAMREATTGYEAKYPQAVERIRSDFYVDDLLSGADNEQEARCLKEQIVEILSSAGFELRKWSSNNENLLAEQHNSEATPVPVKLSEICEAVKALGIQWLPSQDEYSFKVNLPPDSVNTKRQMISDSAKLFDPHGWLAPVLAKIKILYQNLWLFDIAWDDPLPSALAAEWDDIKRNLHLLENIRIPRYLSPFKGRLQLHGFSDASEQAYAAVVYARSVDDEGNISVVLVAAKSRVAPIQQVSLPRLELNGGRLLAELMQRITEALPHLDIEHWAWTDSTILLHWLSAHPRKWKTYVANRTSFILEFLPRSRWNHVVSKENPADLASRGLAPAELVGNQLWFEGAPWLKEDQSKWKMSPAPAVKDEEASEVRKVKILVATIPSRSNFSVERGLLQRRSSFKLIIRVLAWVNRFIQNTKAAVANRHTDPELNPNELDHARTQLARAIQHESFASDIDLLRSGKSLPTKHTLAALHPFLDAHGTMRVGGRLQNSGLTYDMKHPIILPQGHVATEMLVRDLHLRDFHAGSKLLLATLYQQYWIIGSQTVVRKVVQACTRCVRLKARTATQLMGNLPPARVTATRPFSHTGVDYAGPIKLKALCVRGVKVDKGYIAVFVCLSSKAVHLEAASDLSSKTFLNVLKRFVARRGYPNEIHSDNGTNFIGADRIMREFVEQIESHSKEASRYFSNLGVKWIFNPPSAPHMGGIWEAAVKSVKKHLVAEVGDEALTFEDMSTILTQVEACLNSRPLCQLTSDPDSVDALTPGHFLIMQPLNLIPEPNIRHLPQNRLDQYQKLQAHANNIWTRWKDEYLASLQSRGKWRTARPNVEVGQLVLVKNDNAPPTQWELARVDKVHPDSTGMVRTVTLRRGAAIYQRPIHKLCLLPEN